ncbi:hypothetical protein ACFSC4_06970 [Deinococcus malanensis]|uniref:hypothetical protein n=1 Tax=Deinococcus malanensis TaxID=1706855 RepID=UPI0036258974
MPVRIRIYGKEAEFSQGCWSCDDDSLLAMLEALADPRARTEQEEREHAIYAAGRLGADRHSLRLGSGAHAGPRNHAGGRYPRARRTRQRTRRRRIAGAAAPAQVRRPSRSLA